MTGLIAAARARGRRAGVRWSEGRRAEGRRSGDRWSGARRAGGRSVAATAAAAGGDRPWPAAGRPAAGAAAPEAPQP
ncbi:hypothetical protein FH608_042800 [Nonomuraea phyllanthi]|uniref:Uncharacterized protein n=1 Tax=Nonomuraea phyllanthi TaxID=2219224 RepID=A0A5C4VHT2_9ACTN|nr:hypothetical protein FH608_042800 [Nonomuraea phyllanthi]